MFFSLNMEGRRQQSWSRVIGVGGVLLYPSAPSENRQWFVFRVQNISLLHCLLEKCYKVHCVQLVFSLSNFRMKILSCTRNLRSIWIPISGLTLMLKVSVFHSTCVPRPAIIQPSHTVCNGDSGTSSLPSSSTPSCRELNQSSLSYFPSFSDHYMSQKQHIRTCVRTGTQAPAGHSGWIVIRIECFSWRSDIITNWSSFEFWQGNYMLLYGGYHSNWPIFNARRCGVLLEAGG